MATSYRLPLLDLRYCSVCKQTKPESEFYELKHRNTTRRCRECTGVRNRALYHRDKPRVRAVQRKYERSLWEKARAGDKLWHSKKLLKLCRDRARRFELPFSITAADIPVPAVCPMLGIPLVTNARVMGPNSATVDRIVPEIGYVPGNVMVISARANAIKNAATAAEILRVGMFLAQLTAREVA